MTKTLTTALILLTLLLPASACEEYGHGDPYIVHETLLLVNTVDPQRQFLLLHSNGEALLLSTQLTTNGTIANVPSAIWLSPKLDSITIYLEKGLPSYAVAGGSLIVFHYNHDPTVDVTIISSDGSMTTRTGIPFDRTQLPAIPSAWTAFWTGGAAREWARLASQAVGMFSCAASPASSAALADLLAQGCSSAIYSAETRRGMDVPTIDQSNSSANLECALNPQDTHPRSLTGCTSDWMDLGIAMSSQADQVVLANSAIIPTPTK